MACFQHAFGVVQQLLIEKVMVWGFFRVYVYVKLIGVHPSPILFDQALLQALLAAIVPQRYAERLLFGPFVVFYGIYTALNPIRRLCNIWNNDYRSFLSFSNWITLCEGVSILKIERLDVI